MGSDLLVLRFDPLLLFGYFFGEKPKVLPAG
jgi:hypothetical protein